MENRNDSRINEEIIRRRQSNTSGHNATTPSRKVPSQTNIQVSQAARANSVKKTEIDYKPQFRNFGIRFIAGAMGVILGIIFTLITIGIIKIGDRIDELKLEDEIDSAIVQMIAPEEKTANIMTYSAYRNGIGAGDFAYNTNLLAREIVKCAPEYIDLLIYNAYDNMQYNRTYNMNNLINDLWCQTYGLEEKNPEVYHKLKDVRTFEDYLKKIKCVDENGETSIEKYNEYGKSLYELHADNLNSTYGRKK